jgi:hypothetical protein
MSRTRAVLIGAMIVVDIAMTPPAFAQGPIVNATIEHRAVTTGLESAVRGLLARGGKATWIVYRVPMVAGERHMVSADPTIDGRCCVCRLDAGDGVILTDREPRGLRVTIESPREMLVFARIEDRRIARLRTFTPDCEIDAGGMPVVWLDAVSPDDSVGWVASFVSTAMADATSRPDDRVTRGALTAVALHDTAAADRALERFSTPAAPEWLRRETAFWLGAARGDAGYNALTRIIAQDPSERVRERAVFGLSVNTSAASVTSLIGIARNNPSARLRGQALVALGRKAGSRALETMTGAIDEDPEIEVKKRAVFALGQLPKDEGVPKLIELARTHKNPQIRRQAMIVLGRSNDARAVQLFEEVLAR